jgi:pantoate--beta-alanine ligase
MIALKKFLLINDLRKELDKGRKKGKTIGFVPTMGALHEGHLSLIKRSTMENDITVCSIFVNPVQFNNKNDLDRYPRNLAQDLTILENSGCAMTFAPEVSEMYPDGLADQFTIDFGYLERTLEGKFRPGHFKGVAIVVKRLFDIVDPDNAYFGKKDYQQLLIIRQMVERLHLPVEISACDTVREPDGLAMSSRNLRLTIGERNIAPAIYEMLIQVKEKAGSMPVKELKNWAIKKIQKHPEMVVEYFDLVDIETLMPIIKWDQKDHAIACTAINLGDVRLIDNIELFS